MTRTCGRGRSPVSAQVCVWAALSALAFVAVSSIIETPFDPSLPNELNHHRRLGLLTFSGSSDPKTVETIESRVAIDGQLKLMQERQDYIQQQNADLRYQLSALEQQMGYEAQSPSQPQQAMNEIAPTAPNQAPPQVYIGGDRDGVLAARNQEMLQQQGDEEYRYFQRLSDVDLSIDARAQEESRVKAGECSRMLVYLPDPIAYRGHGSQINTYIQGVLAATYMDRAMLLLEPPLDISKYEGGSQFGCPADSFEEVVTGQRQTISFDFPMGLSRLIDQPTWLTRGCSMPCASKLYYEWKQKANSYSLSAREEDMPEWECTGTDGQQISVVITGGSRTKAWFRRHAEVMSRNASPGGGADPQLQSWAMSIGATPNEAGLFSQQRMSAKIWDYALALMNRSGFLKLQPWIARDVEQFIRAMDLPMGERYVAIHVRRGDKLAEEARGNILRYYNQRGYTEQSNLPTDYIPFAHYLEQWDNSDACRVNEPIKHNVYIATDDPVTVRQEIANLPNHITPNTVIWNECHQLTFYFNPADSQAFHLNGDGEKGFGPNHKDAAEQENCLTRYQRNIVGIADMMVLSKAATFIGEYNSNWGRVIRTLRVRLISPSIEAGGNDAKPEELTRVLDTRIAWGSNVVREPGK